MKPIWLTKEQFTMVDDADYDWLNQWKWCINSGKYTFYAKRAIKDPLKGQKIILMHRVILGVIDSKIDVDHKDSNGLNNQRSNLRIATRSQNQANKRSSKNGTSKYLGVCWDKQHKKWEARIKSKRIGQYSDELEAAKCYNEAAIKAHGEFANLNKIL